MREIHLSFIIDNMVCYLFLPVEQMMGSTVIEMSLSSNFFNIVEFREHLGL